MDLDRAAIGKAVLLKMQKHERISIFMSDYGCMAADCAHIKADQRISEMHCCKVIMVHNS